jgi:hypothetical protein
MEAVYGLAFARTSDKILSEKNCIASSAVSVFCEGKITLVENTRNSRTSFPKTYSDIFIGS